MNDVYQATTLWQKSLGQQTDQHRDQIESLRSAYREMRRNSELLVKHIAASLPDLTIHDITHLDALWGISDLIVGDEFSLNPLEGFIFGAAILLHDSGLCFEAFDEGVDGLRATPEWRDYKNLEGLRDAKLNEVESGEIADFKTLRTLHAKKAVDLATKKWESKAAGLDFYLLDNRELREHYGELIGRIASSHHWDIERVEEEFKTQVNPQVQFPPDWIIDPLKIACLLRCADAAHIDSRRAPDFLYLLRKRYGVSEAHWKGQNSLARACPDKEDPTRILFTSTKAFAKRDLPAWWVVYDAIALIDKELKASNEVLKKNNHPQFKIKGVTGAGDPKRLAQFIKTNDWIPSPVSIHVSNVENLVRTLGGEQLYGTENKLVIVLRELIQNARDATAARKELNTAETYASQILIEIVQSPDHECWLSVSDNGVGMSERILTGSLLDFGQSFWLSDIICDEMPSLRSSKFRHVGQYGIGFYSIFMAADEVYIYSRRWSDGLSDTRHLFFSDNLSLRPVLSRGCTGELPIEFSTKVKFKVKKELVNDLKIKFDSHVVGEDSFNVPIGDYIRSIVTGLDTQVYFKGPGDTDRLLIHETIENISADPAKTREWLQDISFARYSPKKDEINKVIESSLNRMKLLKHDGIVYGFAALASGSTQGTFLSHYTVGGLSDKPLFEVNNIGYLECNSKTARREAAVRSLPQSEFNCWIDEQIELIKAAHPPPRELALYYRACP